jgi:site-specific DNA-cytosine methylase
MRKLTFIDLFAGLGGFHKALHEHGLECVFESELDPVLRDTCKMNWSKDVKLQIELLNYNVHRKYNKSIYFNNNSRPDSNNKYENLHFSALENDDTIMFHFHYNFSVPEKIFIEKFKNKQLFNKELLSEIQVEYSSYSSKLGITQILQST